MAKSVGEKNKATIIINTSLKTCEVAAPLENWSHKIQYSDSVENGSIIFSCIGFVF